jgi:hypothetical protein
MDFNVVAEARLVGRSQVKKEKNWPLLVLLMENGKQAARSGRLEHSRDVK